MEHRLFNRTHTELPALEYDVMLHLLHCTIPKASDLLSNFRYRNICKNRIVPLIPKTHWNSKNAESFASVQLLCDDQKRLLCLLYIPFSKNFASSVQMIIFLKFLSSSLILRDSTWCNAMDIIFFFTKIPWIVDIEYLKI